MSSSPLAIRVEGVSKRYELYDCPRHRLNQFVVPRLQRLLGQPQRRYYKEFWALRDVSFEVERGESVGIIGRNGSGKSTLLQIVTGTIAPTSGIVEISGKIGALLELGSGFNPEFTGRENVYLSGALLGLSSEEVDARVDDVAAFADIGDYLDQPIKTYSSGMLVRLAFAVQVQANPDILIIDEALAVGDALFQKRCYQKIEQLISNGVTLLFVSHEQETVRTLTNRALLLNKGAVTSWGKPSEVILAYRKQLHDEESCYFSYVAARINAQQSIAAPEQSKLSVASQSTPSVDSPGQLNRSEKLSFGKEGVFVRSVRTLGVDGEPCSVFYPNDRVRIEVECVSAVDLNHLNVAIRLRNKEGIKIYSWGTLNQDMKFLADGKDPIFWSRQTFVDEIIRVSFEFDCSLGVNLYEIQASVSLEVTPDYTEQRILHWVDEAAFFQVLMRRNEYFFGGVVDLKMHARW